MDIKIAPEKKSSILGNLAQFFHFRALAFKSVREGDLEQALRNVVRAIACIEPLAPPPFFHDPSIERCLIEIAQKLKPLFTEKISQKKSGKIRVAHISPIFVDGGGHASGFLGFLASHDPERFEVKGYSLEYVGFGEAPQGYASFSDLLGPGVVKKIKDRPFPVYFFPPELSYVDKIKALYQKLIEDQIEIAVVHAVTWETLSIVTALLEPGCRFVYLHIADARLNVAPYLLEFHVDLCANVSSPCQEKAKGKKQKFLTFPGLCDFGTLEALDALPYSKEALGLNASDLMVGTFGAQHKIYTPGNFDFLKFMKGLLEKIPNLHYFLLGVEVPYLNLPQVLSDFLGPSLNRRVHLLGMPQNFLRILKTVDLYIDSFPIGGGGTIYQAMACEKPILLRKYEEGTLTLSSWIKTEDALASSTDQLLEKAVELLTNTDKRERLALAIAKEFKTTLHPRKVIQQYETFFERLRSE